MSINIPNNSSFDLEKAKTSNLTIRKGEGLTHALMRAGLSEGASNLRRKDIEAEFRKLSKDIQNKLIELARTIQTNADKNSTKKPAMFHPGDEINKNHEIKRKKQNQKNNQTLNQAPTPQKQKDDNNRGNPTQGTQPNNSKTDYSSFPKDALILQNPEVKNSTQNAQELLKKMQNGEDILGIGKLLPEQKHQKTPNKHDSSPEKKDTKLNTEQQKQAKLNKLNELDAQINALVQGIETKNPQANLSETKSKFGEEKDIFYGYINAINHSKTKEEIQDYLERMDKSLTKLEFIRSNLEKQSQ